MSIVVTAKIPQNAVFFAGERFRCEITFTYLLPSVERLSNDVKAHAKSNSDSKLQGKKMSTRQLLNNNPLSVIVENPSIQSSLAGDLALGGESSAPSNSDETFPQTVPTGSSSSDQNLRGGEPFSYTEIEEMDGDGGLINLQHADASDTVSVSDYDTSESTPRSSVDFYGLGYPERSSNTWGGSLSEYKRHSTSRHSSSPSLIQKYETLLWGFAQIVGQFTVDGLLVKSIEFEPLKTKTMYRPVGGGVTGGAVGGGTLGISNSMHPSSLQDLQERAEDGSRPVYDLMNPVVIYKDEATTSCKEDEMKPQPVHKRDNKREEFLDYVEKLVKNTSNEEIVKNKRTLEKRDSDSYVFVEKDENSVANTATTLSKHMRKANYDICKNNQRVAQLCLLKTSYRLGDIVVGTLNFTGAVIPTYQVSITLENGEIVEPSIANRPQSQIARMTRKVHGEHHEFCLNAQRISFSISIPTNCTPDFSTTGVKLQWCLRLEFITGPKDQLPLVSLNVDERHHYYQAIEEVNVETFDCSIPIKNFNVHIPQASSSSTKPERTQTSVKVASSVPAGTILKGINIFKDGSDPISKLDEEYPEWLWDLLDEEKQNASRENPNYRDYHRYQRKQLIKNNNFDR
ncbi:944_t:CDS:2, partial [Acaulospora colombiana]